MRCGIQSSTVYASLKKAIYLKDNDEFLKGEQMFKVGDWVRVFGKPTQIRSMRNNDEGVEYYDTNPPDYREGMLNPVGLELWQPKQGELIINKDINGIITIEKYYKQLDIYPFIGEITWLHKTD